MKKIIAILLCLAAFIATAQTAKPKNNQPPVDEKNTVPDEVITNDSTFWTISTLSTVGYVNTTPGSNYGTYQSGGGMLIKFNFRKKDRFVFQLYVQANSYGHSSETWTELEGSVVFKKDEKGQNIFVTKAEKGIYRVIRNGYSSSRAIPKAELEAQHSGTYIWERTIFKDDPNHTYLLMVDLKKYPSADINNPASIQPEWVSKFHIPKA